MANAIMAPKRKASRLWVLNDNRLDDIGFIGFPRPARPSGLSPEGSLLACKLFGNILDPQAGNATGIGVQHFENESRFVAQNLPPRGDASGNRKYQSAQRI